MASNSQVGKEKSKYCSWTSEMDKVLGACFIEQLNEGNKLDGKFAWKSTSWTAAINALMVKLNIKVDKNNIQARWKTWEKHYEILHPMLISCNSGTPITWDYTMGRIVVHDENVWNERVKANTKLVPYRRKIVVENWDDICTLFSQERADGQGSRTHQEQTDEIEVNSPTVGDSLDKCDEEVDVSVAELLARQKRKGATSSSTSLGSRKKPSGTTIISDCMKQMTADFSDYMMAEKKKNEFLLGEKKRVNPQVILAELECIGLDNMQKIKAVDLMMHDHVLFDTFVGMPVELKDMWLKMHLDKRS